MEWLLLISLPPLVWAVIIYNKLVSDKNRVLQAWSDIAVQLKLRHDLIPKLITAVNSYAHYERSTLEEITRQRVRADQTEQPVEKARLETVLTEQMCALLAVAEDYPELKADLQYLDLMQQLSDVEDHIQYARRFYNGAVRNLNVRIASFPDLLIARVFRFLPAEYFEMENTLRIRSGAKTR